MTTPFVNIVVKDKINNVEYVVVENIKLSNARVIVNIIKDFLETNKEDNIEIYSKRCKQVDNFEALAKVTNTICKIRKDIEKKYEEETLKSQFEAFAWDEYEEKNKVNDIGEECSKVCD